MMKYIRLLRVKHYIKNFLVMVPVFFSHEMFENGKLKYAIIGVLSFCFMSSAVYINNDLRDVSKDRNHPTKCHRPIASGEVTPRVAKILLGVCVICSFAADCFIPCASSGVFLLIYLLVNVIYSMGIKDYPIIDIAVLSSGYVIRVLYGGVVTGVEVSNWLFLVVVTCALYLGLGKRRNEFYLGTKPETRIVLRYYSKEYLDKFMYVCTSLIIVFYALWTMESSDAGMKWTTPYLITILMKYGLSIDSESDGDPVEVLFHDKILLILVFIYILIIIAILYRIPL